MYITQNVSSKTGWFNRHAESFWMELAWPSSYTVNNNQFLNKHMKFGKCTENIFLSYEQLNEAHCTQSCRLNSEAGSSAQPTKVTWMSERVDMLLFSSQRLDIQSGFPVEQKGKVQCWSGSASIQPTPQTMQDTSQGMSCENHLVTFQHQ